MTYRVYFADGNQRLLDAPSEEACVRHIREVEPARTLAMRELFRDKPEVLDAFPIREVVAITKIEPAPEYD